MHGTLKHIKHNKPLYRLANVADIEVVIFFLVTRQARFAQAV